MNAAAVHTTEGGGCWKDKLRKREKGLLMAENPLKGCRERKMWDNSEGKPWKGIKLQKPQHGWYLRVEGNAAALWGWSKDDIFTEFRKRPNCLQSMVMINEADEMKEEYNMDYAYDLEDEFCGSYLGGSDSHVDE